ncbi:MAG: T9SS type A sorting domain-containing protein [Candidatus Cloacimonetes bacterium]|nr:T9SS type A sorting domain-containing protein [Candidatus Cloacimonadota bacterium]
MMKHYFVVFAVLFILAITPILATNHMDLLYTLEGEFIGAQFGYITISMDFNGDTYDDLIVVSPDWNPTGIYNDAMKYGKMYFYWGGPNFDTIADFVIEGTGHRYFDRNRYGYINAGDVNGDGIDDLVIASWAHGYVKYLWVYFGTTTPSIEPDIAYTFQNIYLLELFALGDINGDYKDDIAINETLSTPRNHRIHVWDDVNSEPWLYRVFTNDSGAPILSGVGDVNGDGYHDLLLQTAVTNSYTNRRYALLYGNSYFPIADSLVISENAPNTPSFFASPIGDVNGDGMADFSAYNGRVWFGSPNLTATPDFRITYYVPISHEWENLEDNAGYPLIYADLNSDGFDDIIGSCSNTGGGNGSVGIWLGKANANGIADLYLYGPTGVGYQCFGWSKAVGDFNADGTPDLAVSAPFWYQDEDWGTSGKVIVYTGNTQLADTTVANEDELLPMPNNGDWRIDIYPNPSTNGKLNICFTGEGYKTTTQVKIEVYNIKGQKLSSTDITHVQITGSEIELVLPNASKGVYLISVKDGEHNLITKKTVIN